MVFVFGSYHTFTLYSAGAHANFTMCTYKHTPCFRENGWRETYSEIFFKEKNRIFSFSYCGQSECERKRRDYRRVFLRIFVRFTSAPCDEKIYSTANARAKNEKCTDTPENNIMRYGLGEKNRGRWIPSRGWRRHGSINYNYRHRKTKIKRLFVHLRTCTYVLVFVINIIITLYYYGRLINVSSTYL